MTSREQSLDELHREFGLVRQELSKVASQIETLQRRTHQLSTLRAAEQTANARIERLERILDFDGVVRHVRSAVAQAELCQHPVAHLRVPNLLPADVYDAVVEALPARAFFDGRAADGREMRVPPRLAPTSSIVTWMFLTDVVLTALSSMLIARLQEPLAAFTRARFPALPPLDDWNVEITLSQGRLVLREPGYPGTATPARPWDFLTTVLCLARPGDDEAFGSWLHALADAGPASVSGSADSIAVAFRANEAVALVGPSEAHAYMPIPPGAPAGTERYSYEFGIGPTQEGRRALAAMMRKG